MLSKGLYVCCLHIWTILKQHMYFHSHQYFLYNLHSHSSVVWRKFCTSQWRIAPLSSKTIVFTEKRWFCKGLTTFFDRNLHHSQAKLLFSLKNIGFVKDCLHFQWKFASLSIKTMIFNQKHWFCKGLSSFFKEICTTLKQNYCF